MPTERWMFRTVRPKLMKVPDLPRKDSRLFLRLGVKVPVNRQSTLSSKSKHHHHGRMSSAVEWLGDVPAENLCAIKNKLGTQDDVRGLFCFYGSWNKGWDLGTIGSVLQRWEPPSIREGKRYVVGMVQVDESDESFAICLGDDGAELHMECPPSELPALGVVLQDASMGHSKIEFVESIVPNDLTVSTPKLWDAVQSAFNSLILQKNFPVSRKPKSKTNGSGRPKAPEGAIRIFVAGDRSSVGKSSVCMGMLGSLLRQGYAASSLAYIKPATQCEATQLVQKFCDARGIACVPIGPVVYFKGFTRAFLAGETDTTAELLAKAKYSVDQLARNKRVVLIDGVGFPAVGSICGTDNASVALACGYGPEKPLSVLVVGPSGVGNAVDSFNLNATYFTSRDIPVIGGLFNKLPLDGYYSLENCRQQVSSYFDQYQTERKAFGFVPMFPKLGDEDALDHLDEFIQLFSDHVDVKGIVQAAEKVKNSTKLLDSKEPTKRMKLAVPPKRKIENGDNGLTARQRIEQQAKEAGAKGG